MAKSTSHPWVLVAAVAIMALALSAVGPVFAQPGARGTNSQGGTSIALQSGDTLGTLVSRYNLSGSDLRNFFTQNTGLVLQPGQTITFPAGVTVNMGGAAGQVTQTATTAAGGLATATSPAGGVATATSAVGGATGTATAAAGGVATGTPSAGGAVTGTPTAAAGGVATGTATSAAGAGAAQVTGTPAATTAAGTPTAMATGAAGTPTAMATVAPTTAATMATTPTAMATVAPTTAATMATTPTTAAGGGGGTGTSQTYTTVQGDTLGKVLGMMGFPVSGAAGGATTGTAPTDAQLEEFATLNSSLQFESGQTAMLPAGIPQTGQGNVTGTPAAGVTGTPGANQGSYTVQAGDTLESIANRYGITVQQLLQMNPNLLQPGMTINVPGGTGNVPGGTGTPGAIPQTGNQAERTFNVQNQETFKRCDFALWPGHQ